jgi:hypothetical protein
MSKDTWERVWYFSKGKDPNELKKKLTKNDILPIIISIVLAFGVAYFFSILFKGILK